MENKMAQELYNDGNHICVAFRDLVKGGAVQANQFLVIDGGHAAIIDPGGELTYSRLFVALTQYINVKGLDYIIASHQDPDIIASIHKWLAGTDCKMVVPELWERFVGHFTRPGKTDNRTIPIPDEGSKLKLGNISLAALPAHFLHAEGNFQFYDPVSKILFSGDLGANLPPGDLDVPVKKLDEIMPYMEGFHKRYMNSNRVCRYWANMVRELEIKMIVPQHGRSIQGKAIPQFIEWISNLECGVDLMTQNNYKLP
jgi:flavorubredoxin